MKLTKEQKKERLGKLFITFITCNLLSESIDADLTDKGLFQRNTKFYAKEFLKCLEKDIIPLYKTLNKPESIEAYAEALNLIQHITKELTAEIINSIEE